MTSPVLVETTGAVTTVTLNAPEYRNALGAPGLREGLNAAIAGFETDPGQRALVLTGANGVFSAGGNLKALVEIRDAAVFRARLDKGAETHRTMVESPKIYVAAVEGPAFGAAMGLALSCDLVVAAASAQFCAAQVRVGAVPDGSLFWSLPSRAGPAVARRIFLTGEVIGAEAALACGIADYVAETGEALNDAQSLARRLAAGPPQALATIKSFFAQSFPDRDSVSEWERTAASQAFASNEFQEGARAFLEKRKPRFGGSE
jgi:enoyl-CoA hydratase/carnithine racemase